MNTSDAALCNRLQAMRVNTALKTTIAEAATLTLAVNRIYELLQEPTPDEALVERLLTRCLEQPDDDIRLAARRIQALNNKVAQLTGYLDQ